MRKEFLTMMTFYIAGLVFVNYAEPLSQTACYIIGWLLSLIHISEPTRP